MPSFISFSWQLYHTISACPQKNAKPTKNSINEPSLYGQDERKTHPRPCRILNLHGIECKKTWHINFPHSMYEYLRTTTDSIYSLHIFIINLEAGPTCEKPKTTTST